MLPGDVLLVASFISYLGCFTKQYRLELFERRWLPYLKKLPKPIPLSLGYVINSTLHSSLSVLQHGFFKTEFIFFIFSWIRYVGANVLSVMTDDAIIAQWNNEGLPSDNMSTENATILTNSVKWPLIIDPQLQGMNDAAQMCPIKYVVLLPSVSNKSDVPMLNKNISRYKVDQEPLREKIDCASPWPARLLGHN